MAEPYFKHHVFCCTNQREADNPRGCCASKDSEQLRDYMKLKAKEMGLTSVRVNNAGCLDRCELGPCLVIYPEGVWYKIETTSDVDAVLEQHVRDGGRATAVVADATDEQATFDLF